MLKKYIIIFFMDNFFVSMQKEMYTKKNKT